MSMDNKVGKGDQDQETYQNDAKARRIFITDGSGNSGGAFGKTILSADIAVSGSGVNTIVSAVATKRIKVISFSVQALGTVNAKWTDETGDLTGAYNFQVREGIAMGVSSPSFLFGTVAGDALILNLSGTVSVVGHVTYFVDDTT